jgi:hypothetical protein
MAFLMLLCRLYRDNLTAHGFRSTFRDWLAERVDFASEVGEMGPAHAVGDKVEAAYCCGEYFGRRRRMMMVWATFRATPKQPLDEIRATRSGDLVRVYDHRRRKMDGEICQPQQFDAPISS